MNRKHLIILLLTIGILLTLVLVGRGEKGDTGDERIVVEVPSPGSIITSPLQIRGRARGTWYFEATFPVVLVDFDGLIIAESYAQAQGEWMTEEFVPFTATLEFDRPAYGERGTLILQRSNPSGLREHDAAVEVPVLFAER